jgi:ribosome maturation protein SDO1
MKMVTVDEAIIAKYEKDGRHFEILVDSELAYELKAGKSVSVQKMLAVNDVYTDSKKGLKASDADVNTVFNTDDIEKVAEIIVKEGDVQITTDFRRKKVEEKKKQIAVLIAKNAINPQTKTPHPQERVENAMEKARVNIDPFASVEKQMGEVIDAIKTILPISIEEAEIEVMIPAKYAGKVFGLLKNIGEVANQEWMNDGSLTVKLKMPAGMKQKAYEKLNSLTEGNAIIKEV